MRSLLVAHQCLQPGLTQEQRWEAPTRVCRVVAVGGPDVVSPLVTTTALRH